MVPHRALSASALRGVVESFVLREGTEYGEHDVPLEQKIAAVMRQLDCGEAQLIFDPHSESVDIVPVRARARRDRSTDSDQD